MNLAVFAYGTLQIPEVMACVAGRQYPAESALLKGFDRYRIRGKSFPGVRPEPGATVEGLLYRNLDTGTLRRLDDFEDDYYLRRELDVITFAGEAVRAQVYVVDKHHYGLLEEATWDLEEFKRQSLTEFLHRCKTFASNQPR